MKAPSSDDLRTLLFDAVAAGDQELLASLCAKHEAAIIDSFPTWQGVPIEFRTPEKLSWYGPGMIAVAQHFDACGRPELMRALTAPPKEGGEERNPLVEWRRDLQAVGALMHELRYDEAISRLRATLQATADLQGSGVEAYQPITLGRLGECLFQSGDAEGALEPTERALKLCWTSGDLDGVASYLGNLYEIHRYRGDGAAAAVCLERLAAVPDRYDDESAARMRQQAAIVRAGEPLCRIVVRLEDGAECELLELPAPPRRISFVFTRNRATLHPSSVAVASGTKAAERGELAAALQHFQRAAAADLFDPWPRYHTAMVLTELRRYREAIDSYEATEGLAPGWYKCRSDRWLAERLASGAVDHETFNALRSVVDGGLSPEQIVARADAALRRCELGLLHLSRGDALTKLRRLEDARDAYRRGLAITDEPDTRTCLLVGLAAATGESPERTHLLHEAIALSGNLVATAMATAMLAAKASRESSR